MGLWWCLVATTVDSSAAGAKLSTDDCRQPVGITDENIFFIFLWREPIFWGNFFFALSSSSVSSAPCSSVYRFRFSDCSLTVPSHHVLVPFHHGLPQNEVGMGTNSFFHSGLCQSVPTFAVYPPCDDPHMLACRGTCHYRTQLLGEPCQVVKQRSST